MIVLGSFVVLVQLLLPLPDFVGTLGGGLLVLGVVLMLFGRTGVARTNADGAATPDDSSRVRGRRGRAKVTRRTPTDAAREGPT